MEITLKEIEKNLLTLPDSLWGQVNDFVIFLKQKYSEDLPGWQKDELRKREYYISENPNSTINEAEMEYFLNTFDDEGKN